MTHNRMGMSAMARGAGLDRGPAAGGDGRLEPFLMAGGRYGSPDGGNR